VLVVGLGNLLLSDDGVGVHAIHELMKDPPPNSLPVDVGTAVLDALDLLENSEAVIAIDAIDYGKSPATLYRFELSDADLSPRQGTLHEITLPVAIGMLPEESRPPVTVFGIQPASLETGTELSPAVRAALPRLLEAVRDEIRSLATSGS
jgi:hydrogenase maturation protease